MIDYRKKTITKGQQQLRCGYTTGTCAAAAAKAAAVALLTGEIYRDVAICLPGGENILLETETLEHQKNCVKCGVIKDAGDDPDITNGLMICAAVEKNTSGEICIDGGEGVGRVTQPGLDQPVGAAAINSVPRKMIQEAVEAVCRQYHYTEGLMVTISIPNGEALACKTFNERLGVVGGLSILGTTGIVRPMSEEAVRESLRLELSMCRAEYGAACALVTGYSGETYLKQTYPNCGGIVLCSNYLGYLLDCAEEMQFTHLLLAGRIGKLIKPAANIMYLHSHTAGGQREILCTHAALAGASRAQVQELYDCPTTKLAQQLLEQFQLSDCVWSSIAAAALENCIWRTHRQITTGLILLDESDHVLAEAGAIPEILQVWRRHGTT